MFKKTLEVYCPKELQDDKDNHNHNQDMDPVTGARKPWAEISAEEAEQPQDEQNYDDGPQHVMPP
jgi:hypothetical protein